MHEWLEQRGGSENVLEVIADTFPDAPVFVPWSNAPERLQDHRVIESVFARSPIRRSKPLAALALPVGWRVMVGRRSRYDWVLASSHAFAHHVVAPGHAGLAPKFVYTHSPARYIWNPELDARGAGVTVRAAAAGLKRLDRRRAQEPVAIAANSEFVRERIRRAWDRDATVIHPPVDIARLQREANWYDRLDGDEREVADGLPTDYLLGASRFVPYKRLDAVIEAGEATDRAVVLAGNGPLLDWLQDRASRASVPVSIVRAPSDALLYTLYERAAALVFPAIEDFGIVPVEAMAVGTPVIAGSVGGTAETVTDGVSGALVPEFSGKSISDALRVVEGLDRSRIRSSARRFAPERFQTELVGWMREHGVDAPAPQQGSTAPFV